MLPKFLHLTLIPLAFSASSCMSWGKFWDIPEITSFAIPARGLTGIIQGTRISLIAESYTTLAPEIATFTTTGVEVKVAGVVQTSGVTANTFGSTVTYRVSGVSGITRDYTVTLMAPRLITGLAAWYRADALALADGASITTWNDSSANANHLTTSLGGTLPQFKLNQLAGKPIGRFVRNGTNDGIYRSSAAGFSGSSFGYFIVLKHSAYNATEQYIFTIDNDTSCTSSGLAATLRLTTWHADIANPCVNYPGTGNPISDTTNFHLISATYNATAPSLNQYLDGSLTQTSSPAITLPAIANVTLGNYPGSNDHSLDGDLAEILIFSGALAEADRIKISCYLSDKYGLATGESCP